MGPEAALVLGAVGFGVGAFGTLIGAGGGFILTPILLLLYPHEPARTLTAISLTAVFFNAASGTAAYARQRRTDFRSGAVFALAALPGAVGGALVVGAVSRRAFDAIMAGVLLLLAAWVIGGERIPVPPATGGLVERRLVDRTGTEYRYRVPIRRRRRHPRAAAGARARLPDAHRDGDVALRPRRDRRRPDARRHRQLPPRPWAAAGRCALARRRPRYAARRAC